MTRRVTVGLLGEGIGRSQAPRLHREAGRLAGLDVTYELFDLGPAEPARFETELAARRRDGLQGVNVTHPFKEHAAHLLPVPDAATRRIGSVNTVRFEDGTGHNTDYTGFVAAYRRHFGAASPGSVLLVGAGGVGKAIAFALARLDPDVRLRIVDVDAEKARGLCRELRLLDIDCEAHEPRELREPARVDGLVNATPLGMHQHPGSAIPLDAVGGQAWAFDAVYTPVETTFLATARARGLEVLTGYELFFYQGLDAFEIFTGVRVDEDGLRRALAVGSP